LTVRRRLGGSFGGGGLVAEVSKTETEVAESVSVTVSSTEVSKMTKTVTSTVSVASMAITVCWGNESTVVSITTVSVSTVCVWGGKVSTVVSITMSQTVSVSVMDWCVVSGVCNLSDGSNWMSVSSVSVTVTQTMTITMGQTMTIAVSQTVTGNMGITVSVRWCDDGSGWLHNGDTVVSWGVQQSTVVSVAVMGNWMHLFDGGGVG